MTLLYIFLGITVFFFVAIFTWNNLQRNKIEQHGEEEISHTTAEEDDGCCGEHAVCEKDSLINSFAEAVEYFDDEELDSYIGTPSDRYSESEVEQFREILYSMYDEDKPKWVRSLQKRNIEIPDQLKDEVILIINDLRSNK